MKKYGAHHMKTGFVNGALEPDLVHLGALEWEIPGSMHLGEVSRAPLVRENVECIDKGKR